MKIFALPVIYLFVLLPFFLLAIFLIYRSYLKHREFNKKALSGMRNYNFSKKDFKFKILFLALSFLLLFVSILRPVWGQKTKTVEVAGSDVVFTLDVSQSMRALDVGKGSTDRLGLAKSMIDNFVSEHAENRYGLVIFAGEAFVSTPLTSDLSAFLTFLSGVNYQDAGKQGTDIKTALQASIDRFYSEQDKKRGRSVVIISDGGEELDGDISSFAEVVKDLNIEIFTVGIGSTKGVPIPAGRDVFGRISYKTYQGETVLTELNEKALKKIAKEAKGEYFHAEDVDDLEQIVKKLEVLETSTIKIREKVGQEDHYQIFLFLSFLFFLLFIFYDLLNFSFLARLKSIQNIKFLLLFLAILPLTACSNNNLGFRYYNTAGNKNYYQNYYQDALEKYELAGESAKSFKYIPDNNIAITKYQEKDYEVAAETLEAAIFIHCEEVKKDKCEDLYYNLGNTYYRQGEEAEEAVRLEQWQKAITAYNQVLEITPDDQEAQENIDFIQNKLASEQEGQEQSGEDGSSEEGEQSEQQEGEAGESQPEGDAQSANDDSAKQGEAGESQEGGEGQSANPDESEGASGEDGAKQGQAGGSEDSEGSGDSAQLDETTNAKVDEYLQGLEAQEKNNQDYFQANPNGDYNSGSSFDQLFNNFLNNSGSGNRFDEEKTNDIDW